MESFTLLNEVLHPSGGSKPSPLPLSVKILLSFSFFILFYYYLSMFFSGSCWWRNWWIRGATVAQQWRNSGGIGVSLTRIGFPITSSHFSSQVSSIHPLQWQ